jgi:2-dehydro-3-deoxyphosphogluconate aldolase/(4S)-4-hydroxy-2-oxoglutarate aldolase
MKLTLAHWQQKIEECGVLAVITIDDIKDAVPTVKALLEGGINGIELTLRTPVALQALKAIREEVPEMFVGLGTLIMPEQVDGAIETGADFAVSPGINLCVIKAIKEKNLPFAPGIMTPSDIELGIEHGFRLFKYFPAESAGGLKHLETIASPYQHLGVKFIPLGGINSFNFSAYLSHPLVAAIGGSWIATQSLIKAKAWATIKNNAKEACKIKNEIGKINTLI